MKKILVIILVVFINPLAAERRAIETLYQEHCSICHEKISSVISLENDRKDLTGKAHYHQPKEASIDGNTSPIFPFDSRLDKKQIQDLTEYISSSLLISVQADKEWGEKAIKASRFDFPVESEINEPVFQANPLNLFLVIESGDHSVTLMDGDKLTPIHRFSTQSPLQGKPLFDSTGRYIYFLTSDGWVSKFDSYQLKMVVKTRIGIKSSSAAISSDNKFIIIGNSMPNTLVILNARELDLVKIIPVEDKKGKSSRVAAVHNAPPSNSFMISLKDSPEIWEINYENPPPAGFGNWVHDYRKDSGEAIVRLFPVRHIKPGRVFDDFFFDKDYVNLISISSSGKGQVVDLDLTRKVADLSIYGMPYLSTAAFWKKDKKSILAMADLNESAVSLIDAKTWKVVTKIPTLGPGVLTHSHEESPHIWINVLSGKDKGAIQIIDKNSFNVIKTLRPSQTSVTAHIGFTRNGRYALASTLGAENALFVYDIKTLQEIKRIPAKYPIGSYNIFNK